MNTRYQYKEGQFLFRRGIGIHIKTQTEIPAPTGAATPTIPAYIVDVIKLARELRDSELLKENIIVTDDQIKRPYELSNP